MGSLSLGTPEPMALRGQGSKERGGTIQHSQTEMFDTFACRDSDTQCDARNSDNISPFLFH